MITTKETANDEKMNAIIAQSSTDITSAINAQLSNFKNDFSSQQKKFEADLEALSSSIADSKTVAQDNLEALAKVINFTMVIYLEITQMYLFILSLGNIY